jgi:hypothetical protein
MKKSIFIFSAIIAIAILFYPQAIISLSTGSPGGKTGSPSDNTDCTSCHTVISTTSTLTSINSNIPSSGYVPGNTYTITAIIDPTSMLSGFEVTCEENTTNTKTGTFFITTPNETQLVNNGSSVTHTAGGNSMNTWSFNWNAPVAGTGEITFYGAFIEAGYPFGQNFDDHFSSTTLSVSEFISPQLTMIPDANFEQELINLGYDTGIPNGSVYTASIDTVTSLDVSSLSITDLTGIEDFTALTYLDCRNTLLTSLDVSANTALTTLFCYNNQLTSLDVSQNTDLDYLMCNNNQLTSLDVSANLALTGLNCLSNQLTSLDVSQNTALTILECDNNQLTSLDVSQNTALTILWCDNNQLTNLDVRNGNNTNFTLFEATTNPNLTCINVDDALWSTTNWIDIDPQHYFSTNCSITDIEEHSTNKELLKITDLLGRETKQTNQSLFYIYDDGTVEKRIVIE